MRLIDFNNEYVSLITNNNLIYEGIAYYTDADTADEFEDTLTIRTVNNDIYEFLESEIKSVKKMKMINVYQSELNKAIPLEYIGKVKYIGESFGVDSLTNGNIYNIVYDENRTIKVVDDSGEDYLYDLKNPRPLDNSSIGGKFEIVEDTNNILSMIIK